MVAANKEDKFVQGDQTSASSLHAKISKESKADIA